MVSKAVYNKDFKSKVQVFENLKRVTRCPVCKSKTIVAGEVVICDDDSCDFIKHYTHLIPSDLVKEEEEEGK